jgi:hypothetical protein
MIWIYTTNRLIWLSGMNRGDYKKGEAESNSYHYA